MGTCNHIGKSLCCGPVDSKLNELNRRFTHPFTHPDITSMKSSSTFAGLFAALNLFALTACQDNILECEDKATIWIVNETVCTPDVEINGDLIIADLAAFDSVSFSANEGTYDIDAKMAFISACDDLSESLVTECGLVYRVVIL